MSNNYDHKLKNISAELTVDRLWIYGSFLVLLISSLFVVYITLIRGRIDLVYLSEDKFDAPMLLDKISTTSDPLKSDRYVKGMVRRFITNWWISPEASRDEVIESLRWGITHTKNGGVRRSKALLKDIDDFDKTRTFKWTSFRPLIDDTSVTIKRSARDSRFQVSVPGTYISVTQEGENYLSGLLRMIILADGVSGKPDPDAGDIVNATGLFIENASVVLQNGSDSPTIIELF